MRKVLKIIFDNTSSPRLPEDLAGFYDYDFPKLQVIHLRDKFAPNSKDPVWLKVIQEEGGWIVITADRGSTCATERLPIICKALKITHVLISAKIHSRGYAATKQAIAEVWKGIVVLSGFPEGTKAKLQYRGTRGHETRPGLFVDGELVKVVSPPTPIIKTQKKPKDSHPSLFDEDEL